MAKRHPSPDQPAYGTLRLADLGLYQCRYACTADDAPRDGHRFCGRPTNVGAGNLHGSWCEEHRLLVWGRGTEGKRSADRLPRSVMEA